MPSVTYEFVPDQIVYVIDDGTVKRGTVTLVEITIDSTETDITYWVLLDGDIAATAFDEEFIFATCRAAPGFQDVVYLFNLEGSPSPVALDLDSDVITASPSIATGSPPTVTMSMQVVVDGNSPAIPVSFDVYVGMTFAEVVSEINTQLYPYATASLFENNIRITSATKGASSSILITE